MPRRGRESHRRASDGARDGGPLNAPFKALRGQLQATARARPRVPPPPPSAPAAPPPDDATLFARAMAGVQPAVGDPTRVAAPPPAAPLRTPVTDDDEALAALTDLVAGETHFDISDTREYVEGAVVGLDARVVRRLRRGEYSPQAHCDLHGHTQAEARVEVERFLVESVRKGLRCVLVVHGRGLNSKDQVPVLKERLKSWLARGRIGRLVLAFASARPRDGGVGALYVLLRRDRRRATIRVTEGTTR